MCTLWVETLAPSARICSNMCMPLPAELPPHLTSDHTSWPLPGQQHVGAFRGPDGWEVAHHGPDPAAPNGYFYKSYGIWAEDPATATAYALWRAWDTVLRQITPSQMRSLLEFFQPRATA